MTQIPDFAVEFGLNPRNGGVQLRLHAIAIRFANDASPPIFQYRENPKGNRKCADERKQKKRAAPGLNHPEIIVEKLAFRQRIRFGRSKSPRASGVDVMRPKNDSYTWEVAELADALA